jgi:hypothetical protein
LQTARKRALDLYIALAEPRPNAAARLPSK